MDVFFAFLATIMFKHPKNFSSLEIALPSVERSTANPGTFEAMPCFERISKTSVTASF